MLQRPASRILSTVALLVLAACSSDKGAPASPEPEPMTDVDEGSFELRVAEPKLPIVQGSSVELRVEVLRKNGFAGAIELSAASLPEGVSMEPATIAAGASSVTVELRAAEQAPHSLPTAVKLRGTAPEHTADVPLTVTVCGHPGALDTSFQGGRVIVPVGAGEDYASALAVQDDGKVLVAGRVAENQGDFALIRLERDGRVDSSFGSGGKVVTDVGGGSDIAHAMALQDDGKIVLAGSAERSGSGLDFAVVRYLANGELDASFGEGGKVITALSPDSDSAYALLIQKDGKIVLGGEANQGSSGSGLDFALLRYNEDGSLDESFGDAGRVLTPIAANGGRDVIYALTSEPMAGEERILAAGGEGDFTLARYTADGELDASFGSGGTLSGLLGSVIGAARAVRVDAAGKILVAGNKSHDFALLRLTEAGAPDASFGSGEPVITPISESNWDEAQSLALDGDGKIVVGGWAYEGNSSSGNFALARYAANGELDADFGDGGVVVTPVASGSKDDLASAVLLQPDERIPAVRVLLAGSANGSNHDFAVTRYWR